MKVNPAKQMMNLGDIEKLTYILEFVFPKGHTEAPDSKVKELYFHYSNNGLLIFIPLPKKPTRKFYIKLRKRYMSLKWHDKTCFVMPLY